MNTIALFSMNIRLLSRFEHSPAPLRRRCRQDGDELVGGNNINELGGGELNRVRFLRRIVRTIGKSHAQALIRYHQKRPAS